MATYDFTGDVTDRRHTGALDTYTRDVVIDFAVQNVAGTDGVTVMNVYEGEFVHNIAVEVVTGEGATATVNIGDGTDPDGFHAVTDIETAAAAVVGGGAYAAAIGKLYAADDTIDLDPTADLDLAKLYIRALITDYKVRTPPIVID